MTQGRAIPGTQNQSEKKSTMAVRQGYSRNIHQAAQANPNHWICKQTRFVRTPNVTFTQKITGKTTLSAHYDHISIHSLWQFIEAG